MKKILLMLLANLLAFYALAQVQVIGKVVEGHTGFALSGVAVKTAGGRATALTNILGVFSLRLNLTADTKLIISYMGYQPIELTAQAIKKDTLFVQLYPLTLQLEEVKVNNGYQQVDRNKLTGAYNLVNQEQLNRRVATGVLERLEDMVPGLIFNRRVATNTTNIVIRGQSTISANADPLIILDNFPFEGDLSAINPNDVESITLLKDAAAASIWGARAGNGVIVITSKAGKLGQPLKIGFTSNLSIAQRPNLYYMPTMSSSDYIDIQQRLFNENYYKATEQNDLNNISHFSLPPLVELLIAQRDGKITPAQAGLVIGTLRNIDNRNDQEKYLYREGLNQQYALNFSGGTSVSKYYLGLGYDNNQYQQIGNGFERISMQLKGNQNMFSNRLGLNIDLFYTQSKNLFNALSLSNLPPYQKLADEYGNPVNVPRYRAAFTERTAKLGFLDWDYYPLIEMHRNDDTEKSDNLRFDVGAAFKLLEGLKISTNYQFAKNERNRLNYMSSNNYYVRNLINTYTQVKTDNSLERAIPVGGILDRSNSLGNNHVLRSQLSFEQLWTKKHQLNIIAGYERRNQQIESFSYRLYGYDDNYAVSLPVDYMGIYQSYATASSRQSIPYNAANSGLIDRFISYYTNANYSFKNKYFLSASARLDRSNLFGVKTNQKGVPLYSLGASWLISDEHFWQAPWLPYLRLRTSFGYNGNIDKNLSAYTTAIYFPAANYVSNKLIGKSYARIENPPNPELRWERIKTVNLGLDFELLKSKQVTGSIDVYQKDGLDLIGPTAFPGSSGIKRFTGNFAATRNIGLDLMINSRNISGAFQWQTSFTFSTLKEKVIGYKNNVTPLTYVTTMGAPLIDKPLYKLFSFKWAGLDPTNGNPRGYVNNLPSTDYAAIMNNATLADLVYHGSIRPTLYGAIRNTFTYKKLSADFNISYRYGYYFRTPSIVYGSTYGLDNRHGDYAKRWKAPGDELITNVPSLPNVINERRDSFYGLSEALVQKGDHIRLQDIRISYLFPKGSLAKSFGPIQIYTYINNIGLLYKVAKGPLDPDFIEREPLPRTISFGFKTEF